MKSNPEIRILPFRNKYQFLVDQMMQEISAEFPDPIFSASSVPIQQVAHVRGYQFWVAIKGQNLAGTIGIVRMKNNSASLKSLFVGKGYRGGGAANFLLQRFLHYSKRKSIRTIYLGTMQQMRGAQKFYEKNGFVRISENELPTDFNRNPLDEVFYKMTL